MQSLEKLQCCLPSLALLRHLPLEIPGGFEGSLSCGGIGKATTESALALPQRLWEYPPKPHPQHRRWGGSATRGSGSEGIRSMAQLCGSKGAQAAQGKGIARVQKAVQRRSRPQMAGSSASEAQASPTALVPIADGSEEMEAVITADVLVRGGVDVTIASAKEDRTLQCTMSRGVKIVADKRISECVGEHYDCVAVPGGAQGAQNLAESESLDTILREQHNAGRLLCAICAAPVRTLTPKGIMDGLKATAHPSFSEHLPDSSCQAGRVMHDGHVITSRAPGTAFEFALCIVQQLVGLDTAKEIMPGMVLPEFKHERSFDNEWLAPSQ